MVFAHVCFVFKYHILILLFCCLFQSFLLSLLALYSTDHDTLLEILLYEWVYTQDRDS